MVPKILIADLSDDDEAALGVAGAEAEDFLQMQERQQLVAQSQHRRVLDPLDAVLAGAAGTNEFEHGELRDGEALARRLDDQRRDDGERQRNLDGEGCSAAGHGLQLDRAADLLDIAAHDVHADAAAGNAGDQRRGGKAGREDEIGDLVFGFARQIGLAGEPDLDRFGFDARGVEAAAVIGDFDDDMTALVTGGKPDRSAGRLAGGKPISRTFDAVIGAIADKMGERIANEFEHLAVELGVSAVHFETRSMPSSAERSRTTRGNFRHDSGATENFGGEFDSEDRLSSDMARLHDVDDGLFSVNRSTYQVQSVVERLSYK